MPQNRLTAYNLESLSFNEERLSNLFDPQPRPGASGSRRRQEPPETTFDDVEMVVENNTGPRRLRNRTISSRQSPRSSPRKRAREETDEKIDSPRNRRAIQNPSIITTSMHPKTRSARRGSDALRDLEENAVLALASMLCDRNSGECSPVRNRNTQGLPGTRVERSNIVI